MSKKCVLAIVYDESLLKYERVPPYVRAAPPGYSAIWMIPTA